MRFCLAAHLIDRQAHAERVLRIVLKQRVGRSRPAAGSCFGIGECRRGGTDNVGAAGCIGDIHALTEQLRHQLHVGGFTAACTGAVELIQRALILAASDGEFIHRIFLGGQRDKIIPVGLLMHLAFQRLHHECLFFCRADACTAAAALAVERIDLDAHGIALKALALDLFCQAAFGSGFSFFGSQEERTDSGVRANQRAHVASDAVFPDPDRYICCNAAAFVFRGLHRADAVCIVHKGGNRDAVALLVVDGDLDFTDVFRKARVNGFRCIRERSPGSGNVNLLYGIQPGIDCSAVHVDDLIALFGVGLYNGLLHIVNRFIQRQHTGEFEEGCLQHSICAVAEAKLLGNVSCIDGVELNVLLRENTLGTVRQMLLKACHIPVGVEEEGAAFLDFGNDIKALHIALLMAGDKVRHRNIVSGADRFMAETEVALGYTAGFFGVVFKVSLRILVGIVSDDFDRVLVCTDSSVRAKPPEFAGDNALSGSDDVFTYRKGGVRHIIVDAYGEVVLSLTLHIVEYCFDVRRDRIL